MTSCSVVVIIIVVVVVVVFAFSSSFISGVSWMTEQDKFDYFLVLCLVICLVGFVLKRVSLNSSTTPGSFNSSISFSVKNLESLWKW